MSTNEEHGSFLYVVIFVGTFWTTVERMLQYLWKSHAMKLTLNQFFVFRDVFFLLLLITLVFGMSLQNSTFLSSVCSLPVVIVIVGNETDASRRFCGSIFGFIMVFKFNCQCQENTVLQQKQADACVCKEDCLGGSGKVLGIYEPIFKEKRPCSV